MRFSVVVCCYNNEEYIGDAVWSVLANDDPTCEIVVVDDGSTDGSREVVARIRDPRIVAIHKENGGQASAFNAGVAASTGDVICLLDGDDFFFPDKLRTLRTVIEEHRLMESPFLIRHPLVRVGTDEGPHREHHGWGHDLQGFVRPIHGRLTPLLQKDAVHRHVRKYGFFTYPCGNASVFNRSMAEKVFPAPEHLSKYYGDYFPIMGACLVGDVYLYGTALGAYRYHGSNHSSRRPPLPSYRFCEGTERYLHELMEREGCELRTDFFGSRLGVRYLAERGRYLESVRRIGKRLLATPDRRTMSDAFYAATMGLAIRVGAVASRTLHDAD